MTEQELWDHAWSRLGAVPRKGLLADLTGAYSEPHRCYHTLQHLEECFAALEGASHLSARLAEVELALWFHDAVYDTRADDNEERSARWAEEELLAGGASDEVAGRVVRLVLATKHEVVPEDGDTRLLVDVDLSVLGADEARFAEYEKQVRQEYSWVADEVFVLGRVRLLTLFLEREFIYGTAWFVERLEAKASRNLVRSLQRLGA